ncbi:MAG: tRNA 2-thiocytidine(32) synthetase TtcA [Firmicutes bacterium]|nr:tRNA 2-thiocytidine(32) synthetase TtcA [Bacillota bacterium]
MKRSFRHNLWHQVGAANADYQLIDEGDHLAIGVSGGKDSVTLLYVLANLRRFAPVKFRLTAVMLDLGWNCDFTPISELCNQLDVPFHLEKTQIGPIVFDYRQEKNPCSLCAKLRRGALHNVAIQLGCNKVALAHHADDAIETLLMSMFYEGRLGAFLPKTYLSRKQLYLIRPLIYVKESTIKEVVAVLKLPVIANPCPVNGRTKRHEVKEIIEQLETLIPDVRDKILSALRNVDLDHLWPPQSFRTNVLK